MTVLIFIGGLFCLLAGAQLLVNSSSTLAIRFGVPAIFIGVTVVAFATSAPEVAVSLGAILGGQSPGLALGNVIGSNIANVLLILGLSAAVAPVEIKSRIVWLDIPVLICSSLIVYLLALDNALQPVDGGILLVLFIAFMIFQIRQARKDKTSTDDYFEENNPKPVYYHGIKLVAGLGLLILGAHWLVESAIAFARFWGMSDLIIGLTIVAIGTSLPELATSVIAAWNNESDISVANVIGSNIFNIFLVLGLTAVFSSGGISITNAALGLDFPFMIAVSIACLPIFFTGHKISRWEGLLFLGYYVAYLFYLFLFSTEHDLLSIFNRVVIFFAVPLTIVGLTVSLYRYLAKK